MVYPPAETVTHPSTNRAQCRLITLIELNALTTILYAATQGSWVLLLIQSCVCALCDIPDLTCYIKRRC